MRPEWLPNHFSAAEGTGIEPARPKSDALAMRLSPLTHLPSRSFAVVVSRHSLALDWQNQRERLTETPTNNRASPRERHGGLE